MTRAEHLQWAKDRALAYVNMGDFAAAYSSFMPDVREHKELANHSGLELGLMLLMGGQLSSGTAMRDFINGFN